MFEDYRPDLLTIHTSSFAENHANSIRFRNLFNAKINTLLMTIKKLLKNYNLVTLLKRYNNFILV